MSKGNMSKMSSSLELEYQALLPQCNYLRTRSPTSSSRPKKSSEEESQPQNSMVSQLSWEPILSIILIDKLAYILFYKNKTCRWSTKAVLKLLLSMILYSKPLLLKSNKPSKPSSGQLKDNLNDLKMIQIFRQAGMASWKTTTENSKSTFLLSFIRD